MTNAGCDRDGSHRQHAIGGVAQAMVRDAGAGEVQCFEEKKDAASGCGTNTSCVPLCVECGGDGARVPYTGVVSHGVAAGIRRLSMGTAWQPNAGSGESSAGCPTASSVGNVQCDVVKKDCASGFAGTDKSPRAPSVEPSAGCASAGMHQTGVGRGANLGPHSMGQSLAPGSGPPVMAAEAGGGQYLVPDIGGEPAAAVRCFKSAPPPVVGAVLVWPGAAACRIWRRC